jgi:hypothetical protein
MNAAKMVALALTLFFICDPTVTGNWLLDQETEGREYVISSSLTWMFYVPALLLLVLSGYSLAVVLIMGKDHFLSEQHHHQERRVNTACKVDTFSFALEGAPE